MINKYLNKLKEGNTPHDLFKNGDGVVYLNDDFSNKVEKDLIKFEYKTLYVNIIVQLCDIYLC